MELRLYPIMLNMYNSKTYLVSRILKIWENKNPLCFLLYR